MCSARPRSIIGVKGAISDIKSSVFHVWSAALSPVSFYPTHLLIHKPKRQSFVAHERLIVTFRVGYAPLEMTTIGQGMHDRAHLPLIIRLLLEKLDPHVGDGHGKTIIEADASFGYWTAESRHTRNVLGNGDHVRVELVKQMIGLVLHEQKNSSGDLPA